MSRTSNFFPPEGVPLCTISQRLDLLDALEDAARRENSRLNGIDIWHSSFVKSFAVLVHPKRQSGKPPGSKYIIEMLDSPYIKALKGKGTKIEEQITRMVFSTLFEAVLREQPKDTHTAPGHLETSIAEGLDDLLQNILGPRRDCPFVGPSTITLYLCRWERRKISNNELVNFDQRDSFISSLMRWIWNDSIPTPQDICILTSYVVTMGPKCMEALISLIHRENGLARKLDLTFSAIDGLEPDPDKFRPGNFLRLAAPLIDLIATHTHQNLGRLSRKQAEQLVSFYDLIRLLDPLYYDSWQFGDGTEIKKQDILESIRQLWTISYGINLFLFAFVHLTDYCTCMQVLVVSVLTMTCSSQIPSQIPSQIKLQFWLKSTTRKYVSSSSIHLCT